MPSVEPKVPIIEHVAEALLCASENGYTFEGWTESVMGGGAQCLESL
jgi:hypothetical protein